MLCTCPSSAYRRPRAAAAVILASALLYGSAARAETASFSPPDLGWPHGIWGDGAGLLVVAGGTRGTVLLGRGAEAQHLSGPRLAQAVDGRGAGSSARVAVVGRDELGLLIDGSWQVVAGPGGDRGDFVDVAVGPDGAVHGASRRAGLATYRDDSWSSLPYPSGFEGEEVAVTRDGAVVVSGRGGLLRVTAGALAPAGLLGDAEARCRRADALWASETTGHLWVGCESRLLLEVDPSDGTVIEHRLEIFGALRAIHGVPGPAGDRVVVAAQSALAQVVGGRVQLLSGRVVFADALYVDQWTGQIWASGRDGVQAVARLALPAPAGSPPAAPPPASPVEAPEPEGTPPPEREVSGADAEAEDGAEAPRRRRGGRGSIIVPRLRFAGGVGAALAPEEHLGFDCDLGLGLLVGRGIGPIMILLSAELGYAYRGAELGGHFFTAALTAMLGNEHIAAGPSITGLVGEGHDDFSFGVRSALRIEGFFGVLGLEVGHEWRRLGDLDIHAIHAVLAVDLGILTVLAIALANPVGFLRTLLWDIPRALLVPRRR